MTGYTDLPQPHGSLHGLTTTTCLVTRTYHNHMTGYTNFTTTTWLARGTYHNHMAGYTDLPTRHGHYADLPQPHDGLQGLYHKPHD